MTEPIFPNVFSKAPSDSLFQRRAAPFAWAMLLALSACATSPQKEVKSGTKPSASSAQGAPRGAAAPIAKPAVEPALPVISVERQEPLPARDLTGQILYQTLLGEIAAERGNTPLMLRAYSELSRSTRDPRIVRRAAELALQARQPDYALEAARLWVEIDPESSEARQMVAGILVGLGRFDEAQPHVAKLLTFESDNLPAALLRLNRLFARSIEKVASRSVVDKLTEPYLQIPEAWFARSEAAAIAGDKAGAVAAIDRALSLRPDWELAMLQKVQLTHDDDPKASIALMAQFLAANPLARDVRLNYARALTGDRQYTEARREFEILRREFPDNLDVLFAVAVLSMQLGDLDAAVPHLKALLDKGYADANQVRLYLGQISEEKKRFDEALQWFYAVTAGQHYLQAQVRAASVLAVQGRLEEARKSLQTASPATRRERLQLVLAESQLLREAHQIEPAYEVLDRALAGDPDDLDLLYETALMAERSGRLDVTESHLRKVIAKKPDHAHAYNALGYSLADKNVRLEEAQALIEKALQLAPEDPFILDSMGWVLFRRGDPQGALQYLKRAFGVRPDPEIAAHLGEVMWVLGQREDAMRVWREASSQFPGNAPLTQTIQRFTP